MAIADTAGVPLELVPEEVTLTVTEALGLFDDPAYCAVIVPVPTGSCEPVTTSVAVAVPAVPVSVAEPSAEPFASKITVPVGVTPFDPTTVAIRARKSLTGDDPTRRSLSPSPGRGKF